MANDLNSAFFLPAGSDKSPLPKTIASAAIIAPTTGLTIVTGTTQIVTITPPLNGWHILYLQFPDAMGAMATSGNILVAADPGVNIPVAMHYNPITAKYTPGPVS